MTLARSWALQQAVYARLTAALAGEDGDGGDVPVHDHPPTDPPRLHVRIDAFTVLDRSPRNAGLGEHAFMVHAFDSPEGDARGAKEAQRVLALCHAALVDWTPFAGEPPVRFSNSFGAPDDDGATYHAWARFLITLGDS